MFITIEGIDGSGKTTQIKHIENHLSSNGISCVVSREPGGTSIGKQIRSILVNAENNKLCPIAELLLCLSDRAQHVKEIIRPSLNKGNVVLCDRHIDSTLAYQGIARELSLSSIIMLNETLCQAPLPSLTILLDIDPKVSIDRIKKRDKDKECCSRFEKEGYDFYVSVRSGYIKIAEMYQDRFRIIDAELEEDVVKEQIKAIIDYTILNNK